MEVDKLWKLANFLSEPWRENSCASGIEIRDAGGRVLISIPKEQPYHRELAYLIVIAPILLKAFLEIHRELLGFTWDTIWYRAQRIDKIIKRVISKIT